MTDPRLPPARRWSSTSAARTGGSSTASAPTPASSPPTSTRSSNSPPRAAHRLFPDLAAPRCGRAGRAVRRARQAGTVTLLDVATPGPGRYLEPLEVVLPHTDVFVPNTDEAELILGESDPVRQALAFHDMGAHRVVITRGELGVVSVSDGLRVKLGAYPISFVDGSGGGDAFNAGYIVGLLEGRSELDCLKLASAVGASCVRAVGTTAGVFTRRRPKSSSTAIRLLSRSSADTQHHLFVWRRGGTPSVKLRPIKVRITLLNIMLAIAVFSITLAICRPKTELWPRYHAATWLSTSVSSHDPASA